MPQTERDPLAGFKQHGVAVLHVTGHEAECRCPWCGKPKLYIHAQRHVWSCKVCGKDGGFAGFLARCSELNAKRPGADEAVQALARDRCLGVGTLRSWGVGYDGRQYTYPLYGMTKNGALVVTDLRRYWIGKTARATTGGHTGLFLRPEEWAERKEGPVYVAEGEWDAMAWGEVLGRDKRPGVVVGVAGASNFPRQMTGLFAGREVRLLFDADEPGQHGAARTWAILDGVAKVRKTLEWDEGLPQGWDIRDLYTRATEDGGCGANARRAFLYVDARLRDRLAGATVAPVAGAPAAAGEDEPNPNGKGLDPKEVLRRYRTWLDMPDGTVLDVLFGTLFANRLEGDPLWLMIVGPPGSAKSELIMPLDGCPKVRCTTSLTPHALISGMNFAGGDPSLIPKIIGKTLAVKDLTTILSLNQTARDEIFGTLRDAYDGRTEKLFGNGTVRHYEGKFGLLAGVTHIIDGATAGNVVLGERFIRYRLRLAGGVTKGAGAILAALRNVAKKTRMRDELRGVAREVLDRPAPYPGEPEPVCPDDIAQKLMELSQWIGSLRAGVERERYTRRLLFKPESEIGTRLATQLCTLGMGIALYYRKPAIDEEIYQVLAQVACDTAPADVETVVRALYLCGPEPVTVKALSDATKFGTDTTRYVLQDLELLHVVAGAGGMVGTWALTDTVRRMMTRMGLYAREKAWKGASGGRRKIARKPCK